MLTTLEHDDGSSFTHTGTCGFTLTGTREAGSFNLDVQIEMGADVSREEMAALVGTFLTFLEEQFDESFVAACAGHYAIETGKKLFEAGDHQIAMIRGGNRGKKKR